MSGCIGNALMSRLPDDAADENLHRSIADARQAEIDQFAALKDKLSEELGGLEPKLDTFLTELHLGALRSTPHSSYPAPVIEIPPAEEIDASEVEELIAPLTAPPATPPLEEDGIQKETAGAEGNGQ
jgi:hypothetical protein